MTSGCQAQAWDRVRFSGSVCEQRVRESDVMAASPSLCAVCGCVSGTGATSNTPQKCLGCHSLQVQLQEVGCKLSLEELGLGAVPRYCGKACQKQGWTAHKSMCGATLLKNPEVVALLEAKSFKKLQNKLIKENRDKLWSIKCKARRGGSYTKLMNYRGDVVGTCMGEGMSGGTVFPKANAPDMQIPAGVPWGVCEKILGLSPMPSNRVPDQRPIGCPIGVTFDSRGFTDSQTVKSGTTNADRSPVAGNREPSRVSSVRRTRDE